MKKFFTVFFVVLGVIFFILILAVTYTYLTNQTKTDCDSSNKDCITNIVTTEKAEVITENPTSTEDKNPDLSPTQERALEVIGVDPTEVPSSFTPEQISCFEAKLGKDRVREIKAGDTPTPTEFFKAKECI